MSIYSRDYMKDSSSSSGPGSWSLVTWLIIINAAMLILTMVVPTATDYLSLSWENLTGFKIWTFITYQFVHKDSFHLVFNMVGLYFLGRMLQQVLGPNHLLKLYLFGGILGGIMQLGLSLLLGERSFVIGASGSVLAIVIALTTYMPHQSVKFFLLPITLKLKHIAFILVGLDLLTLVFQLARPSEDGTAVMAHLGGMLFGFLYIRYWLPRQNTSSQKRPSRKRFGIRILKDDESPSKKSEDSAPPRKKPFIGSEIDAILDKINEKGFQSLTSEEKKMLEKGSKKLSKKIDKD